MYMKIMKRFLYRKEKYSHTLKVFIQVGRILMRFLLHINAYINIFLLNAEMRMTAFEREKYDTVS